MSNELKLKLVKANEREEERKIPISKYSSHYTTKKVKVHDLELHHSETGEPIFRVTPDTGYGSKGKYNLEWHPYMTSQYPDLENSYEHGKKNSSPKYLSTTGGKDYIAGQATQVYKTAARAGFKDSIPHKVTPTPSDEYPLAHKITFHDPETGDPIVTHKSNGWSGKTTYHPEYLEKHGIDQAIVQNSPSHPYDLAKKLYSEKGKSYTAIGVSSHGYHWRQGYGSSSGYMSRGNAATDVYKAGPGVTDEQLSASHEERIRAQYGSNPHFKLERHSPTVFTVVHSTDPDVDKWGKNIHSIAAGGKLFHHEFENYNSQKNTTKF